MTGPSHIATRSDRRSWPVRKCLAPKRNVGERRSDRLDSSSGLSGGRTPGKQRRRHFSELRFYTQGLLPRDLLQQFISTTGGAALAFRFANSGTMSVPGIDQSLSGVNRRWSHWFRLSRACSQRAPGGPSVFAETKLGRNRFGITHRIFFCRAISRSICHDFEG